MRSCLVWFLLMVDWLVLSCCHVDLQVGAAVEAQWIGDEGWYVGVMTCLLVHVPVFLSFFLVSCFLCVYPSCLVLFCCLAVCMYACSRVCSSVRLLVALSTHGRPKAFPLRHPCIVALNTVHRYAGVVEDVLKDNKYGVKWADPQGLADTQVRVQRFFFMCMHVCIHTYI